MSFFAFDWGCCLAKAVEIFCRKRGDALHFLFQFIMRMRHLEMPFWPLSLFRKILQFGRLARANTSYLCGHIKTARAWLFALKLILIRYMISMRFLPAST